MLHLETPGIVEWGWMKTSSSLGMPKMTAEEYCLEFLLVFGTPGQTESENCQVSH